MTQTFSRHEVEDGPPAGQLSFDTGIPGEPIGFRGKQVCAIVEITYRQLDYWARTGLVRPSIADAAGSGTQRMYSYHDLLEIKIIKSLLDAGVALKTARRAIEYLRVHLGEDLASANLVIDGSRSILARSGDEIVDLLRSGQGVLNVVPIGSVAEQLDATIVALVPGVVATNRVRNQGEAGPAEQVAGGI